MSVKTLIKNLSGIKSSRTKQFLVNLAFFTEGVLLLPLILLGLGVALAVLLLMILFRVLGLISLFLAYPFLTFITQSTDPDEDFEYEKFSGFCKFFFEDFVDDYFEILRKIYVFTIVIH